MKNSIKDYFATKKMLRSRIDKLEKEVDSLKDSVFNGYDIIDYEEFQNRFRGSQETIKKRQSEYLRFLNNRTDILDIGCGRGEFLEILKDNNKNPIGVDLYKPYVEICKEKGFKVQLGDGIEYLKTLKDDSLDGIFAFQVIEHITYKKIIELIKTAKKKLREDGVLVLETPNPMSLSIFANSFYMDPTHTKPIHPFTLQYLVEKEGYKVADIWFPDSSRVELKDNSEKMTANLKQVSEIIFRSQDYALVAKK